MPSNTGAPGGKKTGDKMTHYIIEGGAFAKAFETIPAEYLLPWSSAEPEEEVPPGQQVEVHLRRLRGERLGPAEPEDRLRRVRGNHGASRMRKPTVVDGELLAAAALSASMLSQSVKGARMAIAHNIGDVDSARQTIEIFGAIADRYDAALTAAQPPDLESDIDREARDLDARIRLLREASRPLEAIEVVMAKIGYRPTAQGHILSAITQLEARRAKLQGAKR